MSKMAKLSSTLRNDLIPAQKFNKSAIQRKMTKLRHPLHSSFKSSPKGSESPETGPRNIDLKVTKRDSREFGDLIGLDVERQMDESSVSELEDNFKSENFDLGVEQGMGRNTHSSLETRSVLFHSSYLPNLNNFNVLNSSVLEKPKRGSRKVIPFMTFS